MSPNVERESMEVDVLFVGAGPATLASALHLMKQAAARGLEPPTVLVIEKSAGGEMCLLRAARLSPWSTTCLRPKFFQRKDSN